MKLTFEQIRSVCVGAVCAEERDGAIYLTRTTKKQTVLGKLIFTPSYIALTYAFPKSATKLFIFSTYPSNLNFGFLFSLLLLLLLLFPSGLTS